MESREILNRSEFNTDADLNKKIIPFLEGRPKRETVINHEDILNLKIAANTATSLSEFLALI